MSVVTVQLGQCGNQIGEQFFSTLMEDISPNCPTKHPKYCSVATERFFTTDHEGEPQARAVMVDMEPKVIAQTVSMAKHSGVWRYPEKQQFCQKRGSGNNWAHGYYVHGPAGREAIMEIVRQEVEKCDRLDGFLTLLSLAGGTGSGVGAYVTHCLRDEFPHSNMLNPVVWPYTSGEVCVQNYNALLTLAHLHQSCDAIVAVENDNLHQICSRLMAMKKVSFRDLNSVVTHQLAAVLLPAHQGACADPGSAFINNHLGSVLEQVVSHPAYKLLSLRAIPQQSLQARAYSAFRWQGLLKHLRQMLVATATMEEGIDWGVKATPSERHFNHSVANLVVLRGNDLHLADTAPFTDPYLYPRWMPPEGAFDVWSHPRSYYKNEKFAVLLSNSQMPVEPLNRVVSKAWHMFTSRAYVHHYLRHGMTEEDFVNSFATVEQVLNDYVSLGDIGNV